MFDDLYGVVEGKQRAREHVEVSRTERAVFRKLLVFRLNDTSRLFPKAVRTLSILPLL